MRAVHDSRGCEDRGLQLWMGSGQVIWESVRGWGLIHYDEEVMREK